MTRSFIVTTMILLVASACDERKASSPSAAPPMPTAQNAAPPPGDGSRWEAKRGPASLSITNQPGIVVDTNAPPPPPGNPPAQHPFLGASCSGDALGCSEAGTLLRASTSTADFLDRLRKAGFQVAPAR